MRQLILAFLAAGVAVVVLSCLGALLAPNRYVRLHFLSPVTSVGAPLIGIALAIDNGAGLTTAEDLFTVMLLAVSGPVIEAATARLIAEGEGLVPQESPQ